LVTHRYDLNEAKSAYDMLVAGSGARPLGIVIRYPDERQAEPTIGVPVPQGVRTAGPVRGDIGVGFIGAGAFARGVLLPQFSGRSGVALRRVATAHGLSAFDAQRKFGFKEAGTEAADVLADPTVD